MLTYFTQRRWSFAHDNVLQLEKLLNDTDKQIFTVNMNEITNLEDYFDKLGATCKVHVLKEDLNRIDDARKLTKMYVQLSVYSFPFHRLLVHYFLKWWCGFGMIPKKSVERNGQVKEEYQIPKEQIMISLWIDHV